MQVEKVLDNLCQMLRDRKDLTEQTVALHESSSEPPSSLVNLHTKAIPSADPARLKQLLEQMLVSENGDGSLLNRAALRVAGDVELVHHSLISRGLVLYMQSTGLWQTNTSSLPEEHQSRYEIDAGKLDSHLVLDRTAAEAIHLWPPANAGQAVVTGGRTQTNSLAGLISQHTSTVQGKRLLEAWYVRWPFILIYIFSKVFNVRVKSNEPSSFIETCTVEGLAILRFFFFRIGALILQRNTNIFPPSFPFSFLKIFAYLVQASTALGETIAAAASPRRSDCFGRRWCGT